MLVVIAIIAILVALILPSMSKPRAQARQLQCATILRNWGQAFSAYAAMNKGQLPHSADRSANPLFTREADDPRFPHNLCSYTDVLPPLSDRTWLPY